MPPAEVTHGFAGLANKEILDGPWAGLARLIGLSWLALLLRIDAFVSPSGTGLIYTTGTSRVSYGLSRNRYFPEIFGGKVDKNGVPWVGLIFAFIIGLFFLLPFPSWHSLVGLITGASVLMYAGPRCPWARSAARCPSHPGRTGCRPPGPRPGRVRRRRPAHLLVGLRGDLEARRRAGARLRGDRRVHGVRPAAAAAGLEVGGVAAGLADRHGHHLLAGPVQRRPLEYKHPLPPTNTFHIGFWVDILVVIAFSVAIYFWAMRTKLPRDEMLLLVNKQGGGEEELPPAIRH